MPLDSYVVCLFFNTVYTETCCLLFCQTIINTGCTQSHSAQSCTTSVGIYSLWIIQLNRRTEKNITVSFILLYVSFGSDLAILCIHLSHCARCTTTLGATITQNRNARGKLYRRIIKGNHSTTHIYPRRPIYTSHQRQYIIKVPSHPIIRNFEISSVEPKNIIM